MIRVRFQKGLLFYPVLFIAWAWAIKSSYGSFIFQQPPLESTLNDQAFNEMLQGREILANIKVLNEESLSEKDKTEKGHMYHNIGLGYSRLSRISRSRGLLDSAQTYFSKSIGLVPSVARFYCNMGTACAVVHDTSNAKAYYEKAVGLDSQYVAAMHNLGVLLLSEMKRPLEARIYFERLCRLDSTLPIIHYMLGEIELELNNVETAAALFRDELELYDSNQRSARLDGQPRTRAGEQYAAYKSHYRLGQIYATHYKDKTQAKRHFNGYLAMEPAQKERERVSAEILRLVGR